MLDPTLTVTIYSTDFKLSLNDLTLCNRTHISGWILIRYPFENLVRRLGLPVWSANRPSILLWLVITGPAHDAILERSDQGEVAQMVYEQALRRGIPLMVPLMDIQDRGYASASLMRGPFTDRMLAASKRYEPDYIAIARVHATRAIKPWVVELSSIHPEMKSKRSYLPQLN